MTRTFLTIVVGFCLTTVSVAQAISISSRSSHEVAVDGPPQTFRCARNGTLRLFAGREDTDVVMLAASHDRLFVDDDGGGGTTALLEIPVRAGNSLDVSVLSKTAGLGGHVALHAMILSETEESLSLCSLWSVEDRATQHMMSGFYRRFLMERKCAAESLREAQDEMRRARDEEGKPRFAVRDWAGWVIVGEAYGR